MRVAAVEAGDLLWACAGLVAGGPVAIALAGAWVRRAAAPYLYAPGDEVPARRVAIVPGCRVRASGEPLPVLADRLEVARRLLLAGRVERILVSGCAHADGSHDEPAGMARWLAQRDVPEDRVDVDHGGYRTLATMLRAADDGVRGAVVCTQRFHLARSVFLARHAGIDAVGLVADRPGYHTRRDDSLREVVARYRAAVDVIRRRSAPPRP